MSTLEPVSSTNRFEPTSSVWMGEALAIPTFDTVVNAVEALFNRKVWEVCPGFAPYWLTNSSGGSVNSEAAVPDSVISPVAKSYIRSVILGSLKSSLNRMGLRYTAPGLVASIATFDALKTMVFSACSSNVCLPNLILVDRSIVGIFLTI